MNNHPNTLAILIALSGIAILSGAAILITEGPKLIFR